MTRVQRAAEFCFIALIATLPLFSVRLLPGGLSLPFVFIITLALIAGLRFATTFRTAAVFSVTDGGICLYLLAAFITLSSAADLDVFAALKSVAYFMAYLGMKMALADFSFERIKDLTRLGALVGTALFGAIALIALQQSSHVGILFGSFSYNSLTIRVFADIDAVFGQGRESFTSVDVMRNSVGEAFAFYVIVAMAIGYRSRVLTIGVAGANALFALAMFSRRALLAVCFGALSGTTRRGLSLRHVAALGALILAFFAMDSSDEARLTDFTDQARTEQYTEALERFVDSPVLGDGYGAKLSSDQYVHNFVFAGMMMMGILGLISTMVVFGSILHRFCLGLFTKQTAWTTPLLVIPLLGMAVGSTVEGIFTLTGWIALAMHDICRREEVNENV
ncbi:MAG: hypothetical protein GY879_11715 [Planctomycetes bacterium]|nr:hypothetical protein [Planctomycetota bacterium]MCP4860323.1 hypothetical protein [Planctomycetota bacterium]